MGSVLGSATAAVPSSCPRAGGSEAGGRPGAGVPRGRAQQQPRLWGRRMGQRMCHLLAGAAAAGGKTHSWEGVTASSPPAAAGVPGFLCSAASGVFSESLAPCNSCNSTGAAAVTPHPCSGADGDGSAVLALVLLVPVLCLGLARSGQGGGCLPGRAASCSA